MLHGYRIAAVCISCLHEDTLRQFVETLTETLRPHGWRVLIFLTGTDLFQCTPSNKGEEAIFDLMDLSVIDAVILFSEKILDTECRDRIIQRVQEADVPLLLVGGEREGCCCLNFDYVGGFSEVVRHVVEVHHIRDLHLIAGIRDNPFSDERIEAMRRILTEYGIPFGENDVSYGDFWSDPAKAAVRRLIEEKRLPRAIICANDAMALGAAQELRQQGYAVPEDVIVVGFDGIDEIRYSVPKLTSAFSNFSTLGQKAAELCVRLGKGEALPEAVSVLPQLLIQESCGCCRLPDLDPVEFLTHRNNSFNRYYYESETLNEISARIQLCDTVEQVSEVLYDQLFYNLQVFLKKECIDFSLDPMVQHSASTFGKEMYTLLDSDSRDNTGKMIRTTEIVHSMQALLDAGKPLIFLALHYVHLPLGYLCFSYQDYAYQNYLKMFQDAMSIGMALAGFRNRHYQQHLQAVVEEMYKYDTLTGLINRSAFLAQLGRMQLNPEQSYTVVLLDLDGLKMINDNYGHTEGDYAIATVAHCLHEVCISGICTRYGGDEFVALLMYAADREALRSSLLERIAALSADSGKPYPIAASVGIYTGKGESFDEMFAKADEIMYADKSQKPHRRKTDPKP